MKQKPPGKFHMLHSNNLKLKSEPADRNLKWVWLFAIGVALTVCGAKVEAQQPSKVARIGYLSTTSPSTISTRTDSFRQGMRAFGYVEGENIVIEHRYAEGKLDRLPALAADLVRLKADVIVTAGPSATRSAKPSNGYDSHL
jgi:putative ABC transport system substrate-binding protein